jgi:hypothetical protein
MAITGQFNNQIIKLTEKIQIYKNMLKRTPLTPYETMIGLQGIIYPGMKYGLNATTIPWKELDKIQAPLTTALLPKLGCIQHMPRAVVHNPTYFGVWVSNDCLWIRASTMCNIYLEA